MNKFMSFSGPREHSHWKKKYGQGTFSFVFRYIGCPIRKFLGDPDYYFFVGGKQVTPHGK
jgi:hypothetical protein